MEHTEQISVYVSRALDCLGKSQDIVKYRVKLYKKYENFYNSLVNNKLLNTTAGSKGEGLTAPFENDLDMDWELGPIL